MSPRRSNSRTPSAGPSSVRVIPPLHSRDVSSSASPPMSRNRKQRQSPKSKIQKRKKNLEKRRMERNTKWLESRITLVEAILLASRKRKRMAAIAEYRETYWCRDEIPAVRAEKLKNHQDAVMKLLIKKISLPLDQIPTKIFKQLSNFSDSILTDLETKIRAAITKTYEFITESEGSCSKREKGPERRLRLTRLLCSTMDMYLPDVRKLRLLPNSIECCLNLMLFLVEKSYLAQTEEDLTSLQESGADLNFGSEAADRLMARICHDASEKNADGEMVLDIVGTLDTLTLAVEKCGSTRFYEKSIEQLKVMEWEAGYESDEGYSSNESVITIPLPVYSDSSYAPSEASSDGSWSSGPRGHHVYHGYEH